VQDGYKIQCKSILLVLRLTQNYKYRYSLLHLCRDMVMFPNRNTTRAPPGGWQRSASGFCQEMRILKFFSEKKVKFQGHLKVKVKHPYHLVKLFTQGWLCASMKRICPEINKRAKMALYCSPGHYCQFYLWLTHIRTWPRYHSDKHSDQVSLGLRWKCGL